MSNLIISNSYLNIQNRYANSLETPSSKIKFINTLVQRAFSKSEHVWSYLGKIVILSRHLLNASVRTCHYLTLGCRNLDKKIFNIVTRMKLFAIVGIPFTLMSIYSTTQKIFKSYQLHDKEGLALGGLSLTVLAADVVDSFTTFVNAVLLTIAKSPVGIFSAIGMPLAFGMIGLGSTSRTIQIAKTHFLTKELKSTFSKNHGRPSFDQPEAFKTVKQFLEKRVGVSKQEMELITARLNTIQNLSTKEREDLKQKELIKLKEVKKASLLRAAPPEASALLNELYTQFANSATMSAKQAEEVMVKIDHLVSMLDTKKKTDIASLVSNLFALVGLCLFFAAVHPALPFLFLALSFILRIAILGYQDWQKSKAPS